MDLIQELKNCLRCVVSVHTFGYQFDLFVTANLQLGKWGNLFESTNLQKCSAVPENSLHQCQNGCFQVCSDCLPENSKCQECLEYCIITPKVAKDILEIIQKHESRFIPKATIKSYMEKIYETIGENGMIILPLIIVLVIAKYSLSNATFFQVLFLLFVTLIGGVTGASTAIEEFEQEHRDKNPLLAAFLFVFIFPVLAASRLMFGGIIGFTFGCLTLLILNFWSRGYFIEGIICIIAIVSAIYKLLQHEHIQSKLNDLNHKWRKTFGRPLFWILYLCRLYEVFYLNKCSYT